jgi:hypothetical protein
MNDEIKTLVTRTVKETLTTIGLDVTNPIELQKDFQAIREFRETFNSAKKRAILTFIGLVVVAATSALWIGLKSQFTGE